VKNEKQKSNPIRKKIRGMVREEYSRVSKKTIGNELYTTMKSVKSLYDRLSAGNDFEPEDIDRIIQKLQRIKDSAQNFDSGTMPIDPDYR